MSGIRLVTSLLIFVALAHFSSSTVAQTTEDNSNLRLELERVAQRRIFFGHQSVGMNLLDGIKQLATKAGVHIRVMEEPIASKVPSETFGHTFLARNGFPLEKLQNFANAFWQNTSAPDIAIMKFCFLDFTADTDVKALFARYRDTIDGIRAKNPNTTFVHVTAPLTDVQSGIKESIRKLLGRAPYGTIENIRREEYNNLLRQAYLGREPVFDLARIESTAPDGSEVSMEWKGRVAPVLAPMFTDDGAHLNIAGRLRAARELITILATIPSHPAMR